MQLGELRQEFRVSQESAYAEGTNQNLWAMWKSYLLFCLYFQLSWLPASVESIALYAQFLSRSCKSVTTVRNYVSGVKLLQVLSGYSELVFNNVHLKLALRGLERNIGYTPKPSLLISIELHLKRHNLLTFNNVVHVYF